MSASSYKLAVIAGEVSGDLLGADLVRALRTQSSSTIELVGVGGEFNLVTNQSAGDNGSITYEIEKLEYGIGLEFLPVVLSAGRISLKIKTEISEIDNTKGKIRVMVSMFGRDTPVELDALQVKKV